MKIGFDLETTGVNTVTDKPVQIGLVGEDEGDYRIILNTLCNPLMPISEGASNVHGIKDSMVKSAPDYVITAWTLKRIVTALDPKMLITMNGKSFDIPMIDNCFGGSVFGDIPHYDVLQMAFRYFPELKSRKLSALYAYFFNEDLSGAHDAVADIVGTMRVFEAMRTKMGITYEKLLDDLNTPKPYTIMPFGKYAEMSIDDVPVSWARYMAKSDTLSPDLKATVNYVLKRHGENEAWRS